MTFKNVREQPWHWDVPEIACFVFDQLGARTLNLERTEKKQEKSTGQFKT